MVIVRTVTKLIAATLVACGSPGDGGERGARPDTTADAADGSDARDASDGETATGEDVDVDTVPDERDNCVGLFNPDQADDDGDGIGNVCDAEDDDRDHDDVPNLADPFPDDPQRPGIVDSATVYAHTSNQLYKFGVKTQLHVELVGTFAFPSGTSDGRMTDIAIDRYGVMWGIGFEEIFVIEPTTAQVWRIATLPQDFNGLTLVPKSVLGTEHDQLVGVDLQGGWWRLELVHTGTSTQVTTAFVGNYGGSWQSSGDAFSIDGVGTFASVDRGEGTPDQLAKVDPETGLVTQVITALSGYTEVWGLAGWSEKVYAFDASGEVLVVTLATGAVEERVSTGKAWWGAGVRTVIDD